MTESRLVPRSEAWAQAPIERAAELVLSALEVNEVLDQVDRIEMSRGASTSLFGDRAMSGAIAVFSKEPEAAHLRVDFEAGNAGTEELSVGGSNLWRRFAVSGQVRSLNTDG